MKQTTGRQAAAAVSPALAEAALQATPQATPASWYASPRSLAEGRKLSEPEAGSAAWLAAQREARELREAREITEGSWAQPGRRAYTDVDGYDGEVIVTRRYYEDGEHMATITPAPGFPLFWDDQDTLDVPVTELRPLA